ncbi:hypothetical protein P154DRAFT_489679 [Amniculicola lignicola CBS 123094]|uniref:Serine hydrolase domain-containing protein n=1 Tax=Amniculicola lignicola CBS 123094 TaxID=1392246 RepID=A0A6A5WJ89_9PLEO|nr:hypothetical protein P154DRAFT_489679 [Amniculicola lignicola CBS 123094]
MATNSTYMTPSTPPPLVVGAGNITTGGGGGAGGLVNPTLLAFHGSGSNAMIHIVQLARLSRLLKADFEIVSLQAPFPSAAGPGILPFFDGCGPYSRWIPPSENVTTDGMRNGLASSVMSAEVESLVKDAVLEARGKGSKVVGLIGFSQGTRVVAGLMKGCEIRRAVVEAEEGGEKGEEGEDWCDFDFALSVCGSYPPPLLPPSVSARLSASSLSPSAQESILSSRVKLPTLHLEGNADEWAWAAKLLVEGVYEVGEGMSEVRVCEMGHHYPQKVEEIEGVRDWVVGTVRGVGVEKEG